MIIDEKTLRDFTAKIELPSEAYDAALPVCLEILADNADGFENLFAHYRDGDLVYEMADKAGVDRDLYMLACCILIGIRAKDNYVARGIDEKIYFDSMREITVWEKTCQREKQKVGFYEYGWFCSYVAPDIVRLNRLEFHKVHFNAEKWEKHGVTVLKGDTVINMHIPEDGPLLPELVLESFKKAYEYFGCSGKQAFVCESWLLYPGNYDFLPEDSNIRHFMDNFDIIEREDVKNCGDLWRVFGHHKDYNPETLPRRTKLQRCMADYLALHDNVTGNGYGIFLFDGNEVLN